MHATTLEQAYRHCQQTASQHYENFPVASRLLPSRLRRPITVIYTFARQADDLADEGDLSSEQRLQALDAMDASLHKIADSLLQQGSDNRPPQDLADEPLFIALAQVIRDYQLPLQPFHDLLTAFRMDVEKKHFGNFDELMHYCHYSANPIGLLLLHLYQQASTENIEYSNAICSALQLINFYQDLAQDYQENHRIYLPQDEMRHYGVGEQHLRNQITDSAMRDLMQVQIQRAVQLLHSGAPLGNRLRGRVGLEMRMIIQGGRRILQHLQNSRSNLFARPRLNRRDWAWIVWHAIIKSP